MISDRAAALLGVFVDAPLERMLRQSAGSPGVGMWRRASCMAMTSAERLLASEEKTPLHAVASGDRVFAGARRVFASASRDESCTAPSNAHSRLVSERSAGSSHCLKRQAKS